MLVNIKDHKGKLVRDTNSMAILNVDRAALQRHKIYEESIKKEQESLKKEQDMESKINTLETEISSIKTTLDKVLELLNTNRGS